MKALPARFVPASEVAFISGLTTTQVNRVVDDGLLPDLLCSQHGGVRRLSRWAAVFVQFSYATSSVLRPEARKRVVDVCFERLTHYGVSFDLKSSKDEVPEGFSWHVNIDGVEVSLDAYVKQTSERAKALDQLGTLVEENPEVLGGLPVFAGTRLPIDNILATLEQGGEIEQVRAEYPYLTDAHIEAARVYREVHPARGRPRRLRENVSSGPLKVTRRVIGRAP